MSPVFWGYRYGGAKLSAVVPDQNAIKHLFRRGILAAARGTFQVCTLPALPFEEFVQVVDDIRPAEEPPRPQVGMGVNE